MLLFKVNYSYKPKILLTPRQAKKINKITKKKNRETYIAIQKSPQISKVSIKLYEKVL